MVWSEKKQSCLALDIVFQVLITRERDQVTLASLLDLFSKKLKICGYY